MNEQARGPAHQQDRRDGRGRGDTRARIQQVALELFAEQGYDKTSLREIAERLDVTKAALYYHFKSKEDIVRSLVEDYFGQIDALISWARSQPPDASTRGAILSRYVTIVAEKGNVFRMLQHNQAAVNSLSTTKGRGELFRERMTGLIDLLTEPGAPLRDRLRAGMALSGSASAGCSSPTRSPITVSSSLRSSRWPATWRAPACRSGRDPLAKPNERASRRAISPGVIPLPRSGPAAAPGNRSASRARSPWRRGPLPARPRSRR